MPDVMERRIHMVGTHSRDVLDDATAMEDMLDRMGPHLDSLPGGETGRPDWVCEDLDLLTEHPDIRQLGPNEDRDPDDYLHGKWKMAVKDSRKLNPDHIQHTYHQTARNNWPVFSRLRKQYKRPDLPYQVGIIGTLEEPIFAFRRKSVVKTLINGMIRYRKPFEKSLQREVDKITNDTSIGDRHKDQREELKYQIEVPAEVGGMHRMWRWVQPATNPVLAAILARGIKKQAKGMPEDSHVKIHECDGDYENRAFAYASPALLASLGRAIIRGWPKGRSLDVIHIPLAAGDHAPSLNPNHYKALAKLAAKLPEGTRLVAGFVHPGRTLKELFDIRDAIETIVGHRVDIAPSCGLGRVDLETAHNIMDLCVKLVGNRADYDVAA